jgi:hypothetical protein
MLQNPDMELTYFNPVLLLYKRLIMYRKNYTIVCLVTLLLAVNYGAAASGSSKKPDAYVSRDSVIIDTTAVLTGKTWVRRNFNGKPVKNEVEENYGRDGVITMTMLSVGGETITRGRWRREGKLIYLDIDGHSEVQTFKIISISEQRLVMYFLELEMTVELVSKR